MSVLVVEIAGLTYRYPDGTAALNDVRFIVNSLEKVAIVGANGAGKSTLLWHIAGLLPSGGTVRVEGRDPSAAVRRSEIGRVGLAFQDPDDQLFCTTVGEDIAFGPGNQGLAALEIGDRVRDALARVGMAGMESRVPHHLSLGQKKRAALAAVLAMRPSVLVLDEPTGHLDPRGRREITELLENLGGTQIVATHDFELAQRLCARTLVIKDGRLIADGASEALLNDRALLDRAGLS